MPETKEDPDITVRVDKKFATWVVGGIAALVVSNGWIGGRQVQNTDTVTMRLESLNTKLERVIELLESQNATRKRTTAGVPEMLGIAAPDVAGGV